VKGEATEDETQSGTQSGTDTKRDRHKAKAHVSASGSSGHRISDQRGADLLFQVISARYERGSIILTTNKAFKQWPAIFNGDSTITAAVLDRLLHHGHTVVLEGPSYRMKDRAEN
jgi:hypothetical protein